jgi:hypothetical protein
MKLLPLMARIAGLAAILAIGATIMVAPRSAQAKPEFAASTGKPCGACHKSPGGGGALTAAGEAYKAKLKK